MFPRFPAIVSTSSVTTTTAPTGFEIPAFSEFLIRKNGLEAGVKEDFALMRLDGIPWSTTGQHASYPIYVHDFGNHPSNNIGENPNAREVLFVGIGSDGSQPPGGSLCRDPFHQKVAKTRLVRNGSDPAERNVESIFAGQNLAGGTLASGDDHGVPRDNDSGSPHFYVHPQAGLAIAALSREGLGAGVPLNTGAALTDHEQTQAGLYKDDILAAVATWQSGVPVQDREHVIFVTDTIGDLDGDHALTASDITILTREIYARVHRSPVIVRPKNWALDQNGDGVINDTDTTAWCNTFGTTIGDATLDGVVNFNDQTVVSASISNGGSGYGWVDGDFNGDGLVNQTDQALLDQYFQGN